MVQLSSSTKLTIKDLRIWVHLGCGEEEKYHPQLVSITLDINFAVAPLAMTTDRLEDTICYAAIVQQIQQHCTQQRFNLIEHLTHELYQIVHAIADNKKHAINSITITVHKTAPPVPGIHGGVHFSYDAILNNLHS